MFTYLKLHNFKSFGDIEFNFKRTKKETKKFIAIYGENGCGKSNFVSAFDFLVSSYKTLFVRNVIDNLFVNSEEDRIPLVIQKLIKNGIVEYSQYRMLECVEPTSVEYGFEINGKEGFYRLSFVDSVFDEVLYYKINNTRRGEVFHIKKSSEGIIIDINDSTFSPAYRNDFEIELKKYWGKNTFLGIFVKEFYEKNKQYITDNVSEHFFEVMDFLFKINVFERDLKNSTFLKVPNAKEPIAANGIIAPDEENKLDTNAEVISSFFTQLYSDIHDVYYEKNRFEDRIEYKLHIKKMISGKIRDVLFDYESTGTKKTLEIINAMVAVMNGATVIYDEIDEGIHDLLMKSVISSLNSNAKGQLLITTHNTLLLETMDPQSAYVIYADCDGNKEARCCADYGVRVQKTNNMRNQYLKGMFGGIPYTSDIDLSYMTFEDGGDADGE